jgi:hypothetical protein
VLDALISSKTRINLLLKFFLNPESTAYLRSLADEFGESTNAIRLELNKFEGAGMLSSSVQGNRKLFKANKKHPLFPDIRNIILKTVGIDQVIEHVIKNLGNPEKVYLTGDFASGKTSSIIDLVIVGEIKKEMLLSLVEKAEERINKRIRYIHYDSDAFSDSMIEDNKLMLIWHK